MVREWIKKCKQAKSDFENDGDGVYWRTTVENYKPNLDYWLCDCLAFKGSAYHICKHLIRLYIKDDGLVSNKPSMPLYGQVFRQSVPPVLWVAGVHSEDRLVERPLQLNADPPIRRTTVEDTDVPREIDTEILPPVYDSDDEEEQDAEEIERNVPPDTGDTGGNMDVDENEGSRPDDVVDGNNSGFDGGFVESWDEVFDEEFTRPNDDETEESFAEREAQGESVKGSLEMYMSNLNLIVAAVKDALRYPPGHPYLKSVPKVTANNFQTMLSWGVQVDAEVKARKVPITWDKNRSRVLMRGG
jgi:hypothetical protein